MLVLPCMELSTTIVVACLSYVFAWPLWLIITLAVVSFLVFRTVETMWRKNQPKRLTNDEDEQNDG